MKIRDLLNEKGYEVVTVPPSFPVEDVMRLLVEHNIGSVVVTSGTQILGILTERDVLRLGASKPAALEARSVSETMTTDLVVGVSDDAIDYVAGIMTANRIRHLPILDGGQLVGVVSIGDVVNAMKQETEVENRYLRDYIQGAVR